MQLSTKPIQLKSKQANAAAIAAGLADHYGERIRSAVPCVDCALAALADNDAEAVLSWLHATRDALCGTVRVVWEGEEEVD